MSRDGNGTYSNPYPDFISGTVISSSQVDQNNSEMASALTQSIASDGQTTPTANLKMGGFKFTNVGVGSASTDSLSLGQAQAEGFIWCGTMTGTADAGVLTPTPAITAYAAGQRFVWLASANVNTGAMTVAISGLATIAVQSDLAALGAGYHEANQMYMGILDTTGTMQIIKISLSNGVGSLINTLINTQGMINQDGYVSGAATGGANQYTIDMWRVVTSGQNLAWTASENVSTFTAPAGGVEQVVRGNKFLTGTYVISWTGTATCTVDTVAKVSGDTFTLTGGTDATIKFIGGTFTKPKVELGTSPSTFVAEDENEQLKECMNFYRKSYEVGTAIATNTAVGAVARSLTGLATGYMLDSIKFEAMDSVPVVTIYSKIGTSGRVSDGNQADMGASSGLSTFITTGGFVVQNNSGVTLNPAGPNIYYHYVADARP